MINLPMMTLNAVPDGAQIPLDTVEGAEGQSGFSDIFNLAEGGEATKPQTNAGVLAKPDNSELVLTSSDTPEAAQFQRGDALSDDAQSKEDALFQKASNILLPEGTTSKIPRATEDDRGAIDMPIDKPRAAQVISARELTAAGQEGRDAPKIADTAKGDTHKIGTAPSPETLAEITESPRMVPPGSLPVAGQTIETGAREATARTSLDFPVSRPRRPLKNTSILTDGSVAIDRSQPPRQGDGSPLAYGSNGLVNTRPTRPEIASERTGVAVSEQPKTNPHQSKPVMQTADEIVQKAPAKIDKAATESPLIAPKTSLPIESAKTHLQGNETPVLTARVNEQASPELPSFVPAKAPRNPPPIASSTHQMQSIPQQTQSQPNQSAQAAPQSAPVAQVNMAEQGASQVNQSALTPATHSKEPMQPVTRTQQTTPTPPHNQTQTLVHTPSADFVANQPASQTPEIAQIARAIPSTMQDAGDATRKQHFEPAIKEGPPREPGFAPVQQGHTEVAQAPVVIRAPAMTQGLETQQFAVSDGGAVVADASLDSEGLILQPGESRGASTSATRLDFTALPRHEQAANVARQLVEISQRASDRAIELSLSPEELGRVKMSLTGTDGAITVSIVAERQETLDLMRRHVDQLAQEFLGIGYTDVNFTFDQQGDSDADLADSFAAAEGESEQTPDTNSVATAPLAVTTGIDVRL